jgi:hypothetical protein
MGVPAVVGVISGFRGVFDSVFGGDRRHGRAPARRTGHRGRHRAPDGEQQGHEYQDEEAQLLHNAGLSGRSSRAVVHPGQRSLSHAIGWPMSRPGFHR